MEHHRVGYQGEPGAFSEEAVGLLFPEAVAVPHRGLRTIFDHVGSGELDFGVVPLENSQAGSINETYDLLGRGVVRIVAEAILRVDHALLALPGTRMQDVRRVSSHPQALAQCAEFLAGLDAEVVPVYDTAGAAKRIADERAADEAAVAAARAAEIYGLEVLASRIQTNPWNLTRFAAISTDGTPLAPPNRSSLVFDVRNEPGALLRCLEPLAARGINLSKLESRPVGPTPWQYRFYVDVDAGADDAGFDAALSELRNRAASVQVLGSYARWEERSLSR